MADNEKTITATDLAKEFTEKVYKKHFHLTKSARNIDILEQQQEFYAAKLGTGSALYTQTVKNLKDAREAQKIKRSDAMTIVSIVAAPLGTIATTMVGIDMITTAEQTGSCLNSKSMQLVMKPVNFVKNLIK